MALTPEKKEEWEEELAERDYAETAAKIKEDIEKKNHDRYFDRVLNFARIQQQELYEKGNTSQRIREAQMKRDEKLAAELNKIKTEDLRDLKMRQLLRENCPELRELEAKLKTAYVTRELAAQLAEKEAEKLNKKIKEKEVCKVLERARLKEEELRTQRVQEEIIKKHHYKQELQDQMILKERMNRFRYEEFLREKKMIDDIIQRIHDEDEREFEEKMCKMQKTKEEMVTFKAAQEVWKKKERDALEEENRKIQEFLQSKQSDAEAHRQEKLKLEAIKSRITEQIAEKLARDEAKRRERQDIMQELLEQEQIESIEKQHKAEVEKELRTRIEIRESLTKQMKERQERLKEEAKEDALYKEQLIAKLAEDERVEQLSAQKKRLKMLQLRKDVEQTMIERRQKRAEEMQRIMRLLEEEEKEKIERNRVIEEERLRMLKEHAVHLLGYLPKGVLRADDLPHLGSEVMVEYKAKH